MPLKGTSIIIMKMNTGTKYTKGWMDVDSLTNWQGVGVGYQMSALSYISQYMHAMKLHML